MKNFADKDCWELVPRPPDVHVTGGKWVYANKVDSDGSLLQRKARWVAQGYTQVFGLEYDQTYAAVARMESVRITLAIIAALGLTLFQCDFRAAFLNSAISHTVYMRQPEGFAEKGKENWVCRLKKSIYGLKQGGHDWWKTLDSAYQADGYVASRVDPCIRFRRVGDVYTITSTYGDDVVGGSSSEEGRRVAINDLQKRWESQEVTSGVLLGMSISQNPDTKAITISQENYCRNMLQVLGLWDVPCRSTPLPPSTQLSVSVRPVTFTDFVFMQDKPYREFVGSALWVQGCTRPDFSFAAGLLARFQDDPGRQHWECVEWLAGYIKATISVSITYRPTTMMSDMPGWGLKPDAFSDADHAGCLVTRRSTSGFVFFLAGAPVCWKSKRQPTVSLSTTEAELIALSLASQQACWLRNFLAEVDLAVHVPVPILGDNFGSLSLAETSKNQRLVKHIDVKDLFVREVVERGDISLQQVGTEDNVADVFTKPMGRALHNRMLELLRLDGPK